MAGNTGVLCVRERVGEAVRVGSAERRGEEEQARGLSWVIVTPESEASPVVEFRAARLEGERKNKTHKTCCFSGRCLWLAPLLLSRHHRACFRLNFFRRLGVPRPGRVAGQRRLRACETQMEKINKKNHREPRPGKQRLEREPGDIFSLSSLPFPIELLSRHQGFNPACAAPCASPGTSSCTWDTRSRCGRRSCAADTLRTATRPTRCCGPRATPR